MTVIQSLYQVDLRLLLWCRKSRYYPQLMVIVRAISRSGDGYLHLLLPLLYLTLAEQTSEYFLSSVILLFAIERLLYLLLKNLLKRRRPPDIVPDFSAVITASDQFSFPSGHTMAAFLLANLMLTEIGLVALPLLLWAVAVGCSRVLLGVHFPSDILAGATIGSSLILLI